MPIPEEKIVKIIDETVHTRGASVEQVGAQGALVTKVVEPTLPEGASTSVSQEELNSLIETLRELTHRLAVLGSFANAGVAGMRIVGVSMPSTAVTGPITSAQYLANTLTNRAAEQNLTAIQANIINCIGA
jgi:hypothetical protein